MNSDMYKTPEHWQDEAPRRIEDITITTGVKSAAMCVLAVGFLCLAVGVQLTMMVRVYGKFSFVPFVFLVLSPFGFWVGRLVWRMKYLGAILSIFYQSVVVVFSLFWVFLSVGYGLLLVMNLLLPLVGIAGIVLSVLALKPCLLATEARRFWAEKEGLQIDF